MTTPGFQTWFSNRSYAGYSQSEFDTLSEYRTEDGLKRPEDRDFPNHEGLENYVNVYSYQNAVWFFYLRGRRVPGALNVYGAMYLDSAWFDAGQNLRMIRVDIKINTEGDYKFSLNSKK
jgi:hypothetical protein